MKYIVLDYETYDPQINERSWPCGECTALGCALLSSDGLVNGYYLDNTKVFSILQDYQVIVCHNLIYDCGVLSMLGYDITKHTLVDTYILAKLYRNNLLSYKLDNLSEKYLGERKEHEGLKKLALELKERDLLKFTIKQDPVAVLKKNMNLAQEYDLATVEKYALKDVDLTNKLFKFYIERLTIDLDYWSDLLKLLIISRKNGIPVSEEAMEKAEIFFNEKYIEHKSKAYQIAGKEFNLNASDEFYQALVDLDIDLPTSPKTGKYSVVNGWMEKHQHPVFNEIINARMYLKNGRDYITKLRKFIKAGRIYPSLYPLGTDTGRFASRHPNIQQQPSRDKSSQYYCRNIFIAPEGKTWASGDWSAQESRLQVHYAFLAKLPGASSFVVEYRKNPLFDPHLMVAGLCGIDRSQAKIINLGISYGMGKDSLAAQLSLSVEEAVAIKQKYMRKVPYLTELDKLVRRTAEERGYIKTLGGRSLYFDKGFESKALNYLIQGSGGDMAIAALVECYRQKLDVLFSVHDEINILFDNPQDCVKLKDIMESTTKLKIPMIAEVKQGKTWAECK